MALTFITDRTQADVDRLNELRLKRWSELTAAEQSEWLNDGLKGAYNAMDLNRVETAVQVLAAELTALGFPISVTTKTNWLLWHKLDIQYHCVCYLTRFPIRALFHISTKLFSLNLAIIHLEPMCFYRNSIQKAIQDER